MKQESRTKNSTRNILFSAMAYLIQILLGFFVRRYFIFYFGTEYLGFSSLFSNILSVLSLVELGVGSALVFAMYKPMADGENEKVRQLLQFYKKSYTIIGLVIGALGLCVLPFMSYFQTKAPSVEINLYIVYIVFLFNTVISYFFAYRRSLLYVSQRNDIESKVGILVNILSAGLQLAVILFVKNYYAYISVSILSTILSNLIIYLITQKMFADLVKKPAEPLDKTERKSITKNIFALLCHKLGGTVVYSTDSLIIYLMFDAATLGKYSNYLLITSYVTAIINIVLGAIRGSVGNAIASESVDDNYKAFKKLNYAYLWLVSFCSICIFALSDSFIDVVFNKSGVVLTFDFSIILLISISFFILHARYMLCIFKECAGLFRQDRIKPVFEAVINLVVSLALAYLIGLAGIIIGTICSNIMCIIVEPYVVNKHYFKRSTMRYMLRLLYQFLVTAVVGGAMYYLCGLIANDGILNLVLKFAICGVGANVLLLLGLGWLEEFKQCFKWGTGILRNVFRGKKSSQVVEISGVDIDNDGVVDTPPTFINFETVDSDEPQDENK